MCHDMSISISCRPLQEVVMNHNERGEWVENLVNSHTHTHNTQTKTMTFSMGFPSPALLTYVRGWDELTSDLVNWGHVSKIHVVVVYYCHGIDLCRR